MLNFCSNYIEHFLILASVVTGCISSPHFPSLPGILIGSMGCERGLKMCTTTSENKNYKLITKKNKNKKHDKIVAKN